MDKMSGGITSEPKAIVSQKFRYKTDMDRDVLIKNYEKRGWHKHMEKENEPWNIYWTYPWTVKNMFNSGHRLGELQLINHFPNHFELTRKDLMVKNIKRWRKDMEKEGNPIAEKDANGNYVYMDMVPMTYVLPGDYTIFVEEFKRNPHTTWIMKPTNAAQGQGIFLINKLKQINKWANNKTYQAQSQKDPYVVSRYIDRPLLIGSKKFDLRLYVLVTSYRPLKVWLSSLGFARFCNEKYSSDTSELSNMMMHLTNVAVQKNADEYNQEHGSKWSIDNLRFYLEQTRGQELSDKCFKDIDHIIYISLKSVQNLINNDRHCFEMYGYDILIEENLKPWLIEVNASPSLLTTTDSDYKLKKEIMDAVFQIVVPPQWFEENSRHGSNLCTEQEVGSFRVIIDEAHANETKDEKNAPKKASWMAGTVRKL